MELHWEFWGEEQRGCSSGLCPAWATQRHSSPPSLPDFSNQVNSTSLNSPTSRGPMATPSLHPSIGPGIGSSLGSPGQLHSPISTLSSPINGMGPPFSVISSPMGPHSMSVPSTPSLGFGTSSPQVRGHCCLFGQGRATSGGSSSRQAPRGGRKQEIEGKTKLEASCSFGGLQDGLGGTSTAGTRPSIACCLQDGVEGE